MCVFFYLCVYILFIKGKIKILWFVAPECVTYALVLAEKSPHKK